MTGFTLSLVFLSAAIFESTAAYSFYHSARQNAGNEYCKFTCPYLQNSQHVFCSYPVSGAHPRCGKVFQSGFMQDEKNRIVLAHNQHRQYVASGNERRGSNGPQPAAVGGIPDLVWDNELEALAQRWADQCISNEHICSTIDKYPVGQNLYAAFNDFTIEKAVRYWYDEVQEFDRNNINKFRFSMATGHYTQVVWAKTTKIGCGFTKYQPVGSNYIFYYLVCNYGPAGNFHLHEMYKTSNNSPPKKFSQYYYG